MKSPFVVNLAVFFPPIRFLGFPIFVLVVLLVDKNCNTWTYLWQIFIFPSFSHVVFFDLFFNFDLF